ncbi:hypothetical protein LTS08_003736 [Lithohypha guttulata]|nr:hypothetical protein LTS08_003736 [Lithohypha guttulata]
MTAAPGAEETRRAKKRATDRRAQYNHRLRRKAYLQELEDTVKKWNEHHSAEERTQGLLRERDEWKSKCEKLEAQLNRVRTALNVPVEPQTLNTQHDLDDDEPRQRQSSQSVLEHDRDQVLDTTDVRTLPSDASDTDIAQAENRHFAGSYVGGEPGCSSSVPVANNSHYAHDFGLLPVDNYVITNIAIEYPEIHNPSAVDYELMPDLSSTAPLPLLQLPYEPSHQPFLPTGTAYAVGGAGMVKFHFPLLSPPVGEADRMVQRLVEEARSEHLQGRFDASEPSLKKLLADLPSDVLSFRLFHFITSYGPMPLHLLLGIFWVQYLVLRWFALRTQSTYERLPIFMRPTPLECVIPHRPFINMLIWPKIRQKLIQDPRMDPEQFGTSTLQHLETKWSNCAPASLDVLTTIEKQAEDLSWWTLKPDFFKAHPEFSSMNLLEVG